ncbi:MAG: hypothetical protein ABI857_00660 [Acidobacteriota bacterium]
MNEFEPHTADRYLFNEMSEEEQEKFEDTMLGDDDMFYDIAAWENELVDLYSADKLAGEKRERFQRSLAMLPARKDKVANAKLLREFIASERGENKTITIAERSGSFAKLGQLFSFKSPGLQFASIGLIAILALASLYLLRENRRLDALQQQLTDSRQHESELATQIETERETSGDLAADLGAEREKIAKLEAEIAKLRNTQGRPTGDNPPPMIATLVLSSIGIRGDSGVPVRRLELASGVALVSIVIGIPSDAVVGSDIVSVTLNGELVAENLKTRVRHGEKSIAVTVPAAKLKSGRNELTVSEGESAVAASYIIAVTKSQ